MKKLVIAVMAMVAISFASCGNCANGSASVNDSDSVAVDSVDTVIVVDSAAVDSVVCSE